MLKRSVDKITGAASELAYQHRVGNEVDAARAKLKYLKALQKL